MSEHPLVREFRDNREVYVRFARQLEPLIATLLTAEGIRAEPVTSRVKSIESLVEKQVRKGYESLAQVPDLVGLRVIVYHPDDVARAVSVIQNAFDIDGEASGDTAAELAPHEFGYLSMHLEVRLGEERRALPEWRDFGSFRAEVQVRTVLQHAWATISHSLQYKRESDVPKALQRRLHRIAALLEVADQEFLTLTHDHTALRQATDPNQESILVILRRALAHSPHSFEWIRNHASLTLSDDEFQRIIAKCPEEFEAVSIVQRDEAANRVIPGKPGMRLRRKAELPDSAA